MSSRGSGATEGSRQRRPSRANPSPPSPELLREFGARLRRWFRRNGRDLPWRRTRDPYRILVSELMLQQTQVSRVVPKYREFLRTYPTLDSIASSTPKRVCEAWAGLGYYARARNLHKLAVMVAADASSRTTGDRSRSRNGAKAPARLARRCLPDDPAELCTLPGIGAYTAGAVATFAFERRAPIVDTNVARVLRRAFAPHLAPKTPATHRTFWSLAEASLPRTGRAAWTHNQALIELGALVCKPRAPRCGECPVNKLCITNVSGIQSN